MSCLPTDVLTDAMEEVTLNPQLMEDSKDEQEESDQEEDVDDMVTGGLSEDPTPICPTQGKERVLSLEQKVRASLRIVLSLD